MATATIETTVTVEQATETYLNLRDRATNPDGTFDRKGRFYLAQPLACCTSIRRPSAAYPYSEMVHGRTAEHVAHLTGVSAREIKATARKAAK